jgi:hypothetical protein
VKTRTLVTSLSFVLATSSLAACEKKEAPTTASPSASASAAVAAAVAPSASAAPSPSPTDGKMLHCPSAVEGSNTAIKDVPGGVEVTVTARDASDDATVKEIRARSAFLASAAKSTPAAEHNGSGDVGGKFGRCAVVMRDTDVVAKDVPGGSAMTVTSHDAKEQDWLRRESRSRVDELSAPALDEAMHVKEVHCPSAVTGSTTTVTDAPDGVTVAISAKDPAAAKEVRDRMHALLAAVQLGQPGRAGGGGANGTHKGGGGGNGNGNGDGKGGGNGDGTGGGGGGGGHHNGSGAGGGFGTCPLVAHDATIDSSDTDSGVTANLHAKDASQVASLRARVRSRMSAPSPSK